MKKLRVFQTTANRTASGFFAGKSGAVLLCFFLFPYLITLLAGNMQTGNEGEADALRKQLTEGGYEIVNVTALGKERIPLELYVAHSLAGVMGEEYEMEALKAQAVLLRTNLIPEEGKERLVTDTEYGSRKVAARHFQAAAETAGVYLEYEGKPIYGAYFRVSNGSTRNADEVTGTEEYPYLRRKLCERDFLSREYAASFSCPLAEFERKWQKLLKEAPSVLISGEEEGAERCKGGLELLRDSAGYVLAVKYGEEWVQGESFRYEFHLPSADFQITLEENEITFDTKGVGHGLGMSQFGANQLALEGEDYPEILSCFFQEVTFERLSG